MADTNQSDMDEMDSFKVVDEDNEVEFVKEYVSNNTETPEQSDLLKKESDTIEKEPPEECKSVVNTSINEDDEIDNTLDITIENQATNHPYSYLVDSFQFQPDQLRQTKYEAIKHLNETPFKIIASKVAFLKMLQELRVAKEIAIELLVSPSECSADTVWFIGISTKNADYCLDVGKVKLELLLLTEIFINPQIVKIVFGAPRLMSMLQLKFHLYMINIFDVQEADRILIDPRHKLTITKVLKNNYNIMRDRPDNLDFRKRPFPEEHHNYIKCGSHYMIYLYHDYKNLFFDKEESCYQDFLKQSRQVCGTVFTIGETMTLCHLENELKKKHKCELDVLKKLVEWRSTKAQKYNIKATAVLSRYALDKIVSNLCLKESEILFYASSLFVKREVGKIIEMIKESKRNFPYTEIQGKIYKNQNKKPVKRKINPHPFVSEEAKRPNLNRSWSGPKTPNYYSRNFQGNEKKRSSDLPSTSFIPLDPSDMPKSHNSRIQSFKHDNEREFLETSLQNLLNTRNRMRFINSSSSSRELYGIDKKINSFQRRLDSLASNRR